jgi:hypothetical protein
MQYQQLQHFQCLLMRQQVILRALQSLLPAPPTHTPQQHQREGLGDLPGLAVSEIAVFEAAACHLLATACAKTAECSQMLMLAAGVCTAAHCMRRQTTAA